MLTATGLTLGELDRYAGIVDAVANRADQVLVACRLQDVVVLDHLRVRREVRVALGRRFVERLAEQEELELGREHDGVAERGRALDLALQDPARRYLDGSCILFGERVTHHERGGFEPGDAAERGEVRPQRDVAVALVPARELVAREHGHLGIHGKR